MPQFLDDSLDVPIYATVVDSAKTFSRDAERSAAA